VTFVTRFTGRTAADLIARDGAAARTLIGAAGPASEAGILLGAAGDVVAYREAANILRLGPALLGTFKIDNELLVRGADTGAGFVRVKAANAAQVAVGVQDPAGASNLFVVRGGGSLELTEQADPAAPAADVGTLFTRDDGNGNTQYCVRFNTGRIVVLAVDDTPVVLTADLAAYGALALINTTGLAFPVANGVHYGFKFVVLFQTVALTTGIRFGLTFPAVTRFGCSVSIPDAAVDGTAAFWHGRITASGDSVVSAGVEAINTDYVAVIEGVIVPSANGTLQLQHATEVNTSNVLVRQGSYGCLLPL
jgi:hypothetical protein